MRQIRDPNKLRTPFEGRKPQRRRRINKRRLRRFKRRDLGLATRHLIR